MSSYTTIQNILLLIGRILFAAVFILAGFGKITNFAGTVAYMTSAGLPFANILAIIAIIIEIGAGLLIVFGFLTRLSALLILLFTLDVTFGIHHFWTYPPVEAQSQFINFMKNLAIIGGALYIICFGPGKFSIDGCCSKATKK